MVAVAMVATSVNAQPGGSKSNLLFANASIPADARCELKSGIIKYEAVTQGIKVETTSYFDDYGKKQAAVAVVNQGLVQTETKTLQFEDTIYQFKSWAPKLWLAVSAQGIRSRHRRWGRPSTLRCGCGKALL